MTKHVAIKPTDLALDMGVLAALGIHLPAGSFYASDEWKANAQIAMDAQPQLFGTPNAGIPAYLSTIIDPQVVRALFAPMRAAELYPEVKKGDWTTTTAEFPTIEPAGQVTSYGDWNNNGNVNANVNWTPRQSYGYQTVEQYGEKTLARFGLAKINYKSELDIAAALVMAKFQNQTYIYGVANLQNYGILNDPSLPAAILPTVKAAGGYLWTVATTQEIYADFLKEFGQLQTQAGGLLKQTDRIRVALSPGRAVLLSTINMYGLTPLGTIKIGFPNLELVQIPEFSTPSGELMQMVAESLDGTATGQLAYTEKMRSHQVIPSLSGWMQKKSGGTWGSIIKRPVLVSQMLGI
jgi:hypothetical protein